MAIVKEDTREILSTLQKKMLPYITLPMPSECPTALRYALAKYDATSVTEAYEGLWDMASRGLLGNDRPKD